MAIQNHVSDSHDGSVGKNKRYWAKVRQITPIICWLIFLIGFYLPFLVYNSNRSYFPEYYSELIFPVTLAAFSIVVVLTLLVSAVPTNLFRYITSILLVLGFVFWGMGDYFSVSYGQLNGLGLVFSQHANRGRLELWVILPLLLAAILFRKQILDNLSFIVLLILLAQIAIVIKGVITEPIDKQVQKESVDDEVFGVSQNKNIFIIVLDTFGSEYFQQILKEQAGLKHELKGFISYKDAISNYPVTKASIPSFLMGELIPEDVQYQKYLSDYVSEKGLPKQFEQMGYIVSVLSTSYLWFHHLYKKRFYYQLPKVEGYIKSNYWQLLDYAIFRMTPHILKPNVYNRGAWLVSNYVESGSPYRNEKPWISALVMDEYKEKMEVRGEEPRFKFLHFTLPHPKLIFDANCQLLTRFNYDDENMLNQSKCTLKKLLAIFEKMKHLNVFDSSLIVVMSDHGARMFESMQEDGLPSDYELKSAGILLMIKGVDALHPFEQVETPVSLIQVNKFIQDLSRHAGKIDWLEEGIRYFSSYRNEMLIRNTELANGIIYKVGENFSNPQSWEMERVTLRGCEPTKIPVRLNLESKNKGSICYRYGLSTYLKAKGGLRIVGDEAIVAWNSQVNKSNSEDYWQLLLKLESNQSTDALVMVNGDQTTAKSFRLNKGNNEIDFNLKAEHLNGNTALHLELMDKNTNYDLSQPKSITKVFLQGIEIKTN